MYGNTLSSGAKWIFFGFVVVIVMALLLGVNIKEATWLNSSIAEAQAERIQIESAHQRATYELQERLATAQTEAGVQKIQREQRLLDAQFEHDMQILVQDVINRQRWADTKIDLVAFIGNTAGIAAAVSAVIIAIAKAIAILRTLPKREPSVRSLPEIQPVRPLPERMPYDPWHNEEYRRAKIKEARDREQVYRKTTPQNLRDNLPHAAD